MTCEFAGAAEQQTGIRCDRWKMVPPVATAEMVSATRSVEVLVAIGSDETTGIDDDEAAALWAVMFAASPASPDGRYGEPADKAFDRGVLIAAATLINHWGDSTEADHLLGMINANAEMIESMDFTDYDREPLLAAIARIAEQDAAQ